MAPVTTSSNPRGLPARPDRTSGLSRRASSKSALGALGDRACGAFDEICKAAPRGHQPGGLIETCPPVRYTIKFTAQLKITNGEIGVG